MAAPHTINLSTYSANEIRRNGPELDFLSDKENVTILVLSIRNPILTGPHPLALPLFKKENKVLCEQISGSCASRSITSSARINLPEAASNLILSTNSFLLSN